jgi:hypothetical protein
LHSRIVVIGRNATVRARLAQLVSRAGHCVEVRRVSRMPAALALTALR